MECSVLRGMPEFREDMDEFLGRKGKKVMISWSFAGNRSFMEDQFLEYLVSYRRPILPSYGLL